jgi:imidazoleglycerol phosphate dehydratase HisB
LALFLAREFFQGFGNEARRNLHLEPLYGDEPHQIIPATKPSTAAFAGSVQSRSQTISALELN